MANGSGSRHRAKTSSKSQQNTSKQDEDTAAGSMMVDKDSEVLDLTLPAESSEISQDAGSRKEIPRFNNTLHDTPLYQIWESIDYVLEIMHYVLDIV